MTSNPNPIGDRISAALKSEPPSAELAALLEEARIEHERLGHDAEQARQAALDPAATEAEAARSREQAALLSWRAERLAAGMACLTEALANARKREEQDGRRAAYDEAAAALEAADAALRARYDALAAEMRDLMLSAAAAYDAALRANDALPGGAAPLAIPATISGAIPARAERIVGERTVERWVREHTTEIIDERHLEEGAGKRRRIKVAPDSRGNVAEVFAVRSAFREITFVPARGAERGLPIFAATALPGLAGGLPWWTAQDGRPDPKQALVAAHERETRRAAGADGEPTRTRLEPVPSKVTALRSAAA